MEKDIKHSNEVDILIIGEGTYPYIHGGVSSWIHQLITELKEFKFGVIFLGGKKEDYGEMRYQFPDNLLHFESHYLFDGYEKPEVKRIKGDKKVFDYVSRLHEWFRLNLNTLSILNEIDGIDSHLEYVDENQFLYARRAWEFIREQYEKYCSDLPFIDYFWAVKSIHAPIWKVARIASQGKTAKVIHSPSTGYAGLLGAILSSSTSKPFILTEHGIYTKERKVDILSVEWIRDGKPLILKQPAETSYIREMWTKFFDFIGKFCYRRANPIIALFKDAKTIQITLGADPQRTMVIPNGVDTKKLGTLIEKRDKNIPKVVALIGRIVPIKDVKTFIRAIRIAVNYIPEIEGWVVGPQDEDPIYAAECVDMVEILGLQKNVKFLGFQSIYDILHKTGIVTLTSISEGMPLAILEGFAAGLPAVGTDVGSCRELIYGGIDEYDVSLGKCGEVVPIANPSALAKAYIEILNNEHLWKAYQETAIKRARKYYNLETFFQSYKNIYLEAISGGRYRV